MFFKTFAQKELERKGREYDLLARRLKQVNRLQLEREALEMLLKRETGWGDEELSFELRRQLEH